MNWKIPLFKMYWDDDDISLVNEAIRSGMNWASGPQISEFEQKIAEYIGSRYCLTFNSGTSALHAALLAHGIKKNDEIRRVKDVEGFELVKSGWIFIKKSEWKKGVRDKGKVEKKEKVEKVEKKEKGIRPSSQSKYRDKKAKQE